MKTTYHVIIVGCGMAGMSAADTLTGHGLDILIIDENSHVGGQLIRKVPKKAALFSRIEPDVMKKKGFALVRKIKKQNLKQDKNASHHGMTRRVQAQVMGIFDDNRLLIRMTSPDRQNKQNNGEKILTLQAEHLILATGARERYLPFKGWDLPGVISLGAAQIFMKSNGVLPARETFIAGSSPLQMVLATEMLSNGGKVTALLDENNFKKKLGFLPYAMDHWPKLMEGGFHMGKMVLARIPMRQGVRVVEACGQRSGPQGLEAIIVAKTNVKGDVIRGTETTYETRSLCMGYGFVPNIELPIQAGCDTVYDKNKGGWVVLVNDRLETSIPSVFAAGEITGIAGAKKSHVEGMLAALSILERYDISADNVWNNDHIRPPDTTNHERNRPIDRECFHINAHGLPPTTNNESLDMPLAINSFQIKSGDQLSAFEQKFRKLLSQRRRQMDYGLFLNSLCRVPSSAYAAIPDDTVICRCEEITMGAIKKSVSQGFHTTGALKKATRCGMGRCQGRICGPVLFDIMTALTQKRAEEIGASHSRTPVKNMPVSAFF